jgi:hypothetical protein
MDTKTSTVPASTDPKTSQNCFVSLLSYLPTFLAVLPENPSPCLQSHQKFFRDSISFPPKPFHSPSSLVQTDSAHNGSSILHNLSPSLALHAHSVAAINWISLYSIPHTSSQAPMHSHATLMERQPPQKKKAQQSRISVSRIRERSHWYGDLLSCYTWTKHCWNNILVH